jgi:hypothetical protein
MKEVIQVGKIIYSDEKQELKPLSELGIDYVLRYGDTKTEFRKLNYSKYKEYGYAFLDDRIDPSFFSDKEIEYVCSEFYLKKTKNNTVDLQEFW